MERDFDFWVGEWDVRTADGEAAGHNRITRILDGRALREDWAGAKGSVGTSLNAWSAQRRVWHQTWIDSAGTLLMLDGGLNDDGAMVMEGDGVGEDGAPIRHRITWSNVEGNPDRVRQHWQTSADRGATWQTAFDGRYERAVPATANRLSRRKRP